MKRPTSVTVIGWFLIVVGIFSAFGIFSFVGMMKNPDAQPPAVQEMLAQNPLPLSGQLALSAAGLVVSVVCGIFFLRGANWSRYLYLVWGAFGFLFGLFTTPAKLMLIPGLVLYLVVAYFLLNRKAAAYFTGAGPDASADA